MCTYEVVLLAVWVELEVHSRYIYAWLCYKTISAMALKLMLPFLFPLLFAVKPVQSQGIYELAVIIIVLCTSINYGLQDEATFFDDLLHK